MKKFILLILLFLMFMPFIVNAETCDTDKITVENITIESKSDNVEELDEATANGKNINLNLSMSEVGDNIEYKFVVKNNSNEDYELDKTSLNISSDYINYSFETEDNFNVVKANSSKNVTLRVVYKNEVSEDKFESGSYTDSKTVTVQLSNGNTINVPDTFKNPNTGVQSYILILFILLLMCVTLYVLLKKKKYTKFMILIIGTAIIIPISAYALCKCNIAINSNIEIIRRTECNSFEDDNWNSISNNIKTLNTSCYHVGDTKLINIEGYGTQEIRIANMTTPAECATKEYSQTACGFVVEFSTIVFANRVSFRPTGAYTNSNYGGWPVSEIRTILNNYFYTNLPSELKNVIIDTKVVSGHGINDTENFITTDKVYILTPREIYGDYISGGSGYWMETEGLNDFTRQLDYYENSNVTNLNYSGAKKTLNGQPYYYWLRSAPSNSYDYFYYVLSGGDVNTNDGVYSAGISPVFRIG